MFQTNPRNLDSVKSAHPEKFITARDVMSGLRPGSRIFIGSGCGEPQHLTRALLDRARGLAELISYRPFYLVGLGMTPRTEPRYPEHFNLDTFFICADTREDVNRAAVDYTPVHLSSLVDLINRGMFPIDVALIQTSYPDWRGFVNLGISVDIVRAAVEAADVVVAQLNAYMPRTHGDGFVHTRDIDYFVSHDEALLEYQEKVPDDIASKIGGYVSSIISNGDTLEVGYGSVPDAVLRHLEGKKDLGIHTDLFTDGIASLMEAGAVTNMKKTINRGKTIAALCMGSSRTYEYVHENPLVEFKPTDYTNNPLVIAQHRNMTAINSALTVDLTGQATAESIGTTFYSGLGGHADFMRGAVLATGGKTILAMQSTAENGEVSRIVPFLNEGEGVTMNRGDIHYVVTEYGIAYLHGKNIRERAMELIAVAHPDFREKLVKTAREKKIIFTDQAFVPGVEGQYPEHLEQFRITKTGLELLFRPVKITDEPLLKEFFYSLSDITIYKRFFSKRTDMPHEALQKYSVIDYTEEMVVVAVLVDGEKETAVAMGQYKITKETHTADAAIVVRDDHQGKGIGTELSKYLVYLARRGGLVAFTADVLHENEAMLHIFEKSGFDIERTSEHGVFRVRLNFKKDV